MFDIYLAGPYSDDNSLVRIERHVIHCMAAALLMRMGHTVFSPIAHGCAIETTGNLINPDHEFWMQQCKAAMDSCMEMRILKTYGWESSRGLAEAIKYATAKGMPMRDIRCEKRGDGGLWSFEIL